ncbi:4-hydroxy-2-oxoheptanedioate aldolase [Streptomyces coacervatus]|uniref:4-hydroxy-2-oxoheptanedioate aldolase n=1 Tax=Streptomyces coacervatus TaxID=647381 RepID=A0ABP7JDE4_9ACTN|nr:aldolase/citrate lyase family protein [Streptomyces coacervatus]MDF2264286.1 aldolase/citrate lyase family protein [Streptomyces coacervatus]
MSAQPAPGQWPLPPNAFKAALSRGEQLIGLWCSLADPYPAEIVAGAGFDWLLLDTEHSHADVATVLSQLQAVAPYPCSPVVRPPVNDPVVIKRLLDVGAQSLLIPQVESAEEARAAVAATRYAPTGVRGVSALTRATRFGRVEDYAALAHTELCVLVQVESRRALGQIERIASVDGVDGIFIGPGDLAASLGHPGDPNAPSVVAAVEEAIGRVRAAGKPAGLLTTNPAFARRCIDLGTTFTAVGVDVGLLARGADLLARTFTPQAAAPAAVNRSP